VDTLFLDYPSSTGENAFDTHKTLNDLPGTPIALGVIKRPVTIERSPREPPLNMKTFIAVCAVAIATLIVLEPAFADGKAKGHKKVKPAAIRVPVAPSTKQPWVGHNVTISESERHVIRAYAFDRVHASKGGKFNGVPQGLAKKVAWGNSLPPGWQKKCVRGQVLPTEIHKHCQPLPHDIIVKLPPPPAGTVLLAVDGKVLRVAYPTYEILDVFDVL
jgi:hypothetical protein